MDMDLYLALQDEIHRFNVAIHRGLRPTVYRGKKTYVIQWAFLESDILWFNTYEMIRTPPFLHVHIPHIHNEVLYCTGEEEWMRLLEESSMQRHPHFHEVAATGKFVTGTLDKSVTQKLK